ncbi:hypothetical protein EVAR_52590_1 [Eumeta japonica]|uniref:Uncharacterized protein n=1 Tax=Eumeta variegata TaxID=151549 RepID=A0A4C1YPS8_EUMVA|nr:hypothetical protein EVAR_52590_1 [Eumeta japonica]
MKGMGRNLCHKHKLRPSAARVAKPPLFKCSCAAADCPDSYTEIDLNLDTDPVSDLDPDANIERNLFQKKSNPKKVHNIIVIIREEYISFKLMKAYHQQHGEGSEVLKLLKNALPIPSSDVRHAMSDTSKITEAPFTSSRRQSLIVNCHRITIAKSLPESSQA